MKYERAGVERTRLYSDDRTPKGSKNMEQTDRTEDIMPMFAYEHLPPHLREVSKPFGDLARQLVETLPANRWREKALDELLLAKDAAVRAKLAK